MNVHIYGIKNCDTMKKAFAWLDAHKIAYEFHDYKKEGANQEIVKKAIDQHGWENVVNRKGTTWRVLPDDIKSAMNDYKALSVALENPSIIKRPLLLHDDAIYLGFDEETYAIIMTV